MLKLGNIAPFSGLQRAVLQVGPESFLSSSLGSESSVASPAVSLLLASLSGSASSRRPSGLRRVAGLWLGHNCRFNATAGKAGRALTVRWAL